MNDNILEIRGMTVRSGVGSGPALVHDVSLDLRRGEIVCLVGESGSG